MTTQAPSVQDLPAEQIAKISNSIKEHEETNNNLRNSARDEANILKDHRIQFEDMLCSLRIFRADDKSDDADATALSLKQVRLQMLERRNKVNNLWETINNNKRMISDLKSEISKIDRVLRLNKYKASMLNRRSKKQQKSEEDESEVEIDVNAEEVEDM